MSLTQKVCNQPGCERPFRAKGMCSAHWFRSHHGLPMDTPIRPKGDGIRCQATACKRGGTYEGLCKTHFERKKAGEPEGGPSKREPTCATEGCNQQPRKRSRFCESHMAEWLTQSERLFPKQGRIKGEVQGNCSYEPCDRKQASNGLCGTHWSQVFRYGIDPKPIRAVVKRGSIVCMASGCEKMNEKGPYCLVHYHRLYDRGAETASRVRGAVPGRSCVVPQCGRGCHVSYFLCDRHASVSRQYKLSTLQLVMLNEIGCQICGGVDDLHIDHDHACCTREANDKNYCGNCNRGILCRNCNFGLGWFRDNEGTLQSAIDYLRRV